MRIPVALPLLIILVLSVAGSGQDDARRTVWDGVYTAEQAGRGRNQYDIHCSGCHGAGSGGAPELNGEQFLEDWGEDNLVSLFDRIQSTMPARDPSSLDEEVYRDIVAHMLEVNGFPAGDRELRVDEMASIRVENRSGPGEVPNYSLVEAVGCLDRDDQGRWIASRVTELTRTRDPAPSAQERLRDLAQQPLGGRTYELIYAYPDPAPYDGHKIEVKGFLIRDAEPNQINVSSYSSLGPACADPD
jgi:mono/diheme cytochrome c family protein